jgi:hypothetical protein
MRQCSKCGRKIRKDCESEVCRSCRKAAEKQEERSFQTTLRGQGRPVRYGGTAICKMPHCHRKYEVAHNMEPRFSWYCPQCRKEIEEITTGVLWLESWGITLAPTAEILEDSLAKAFDIDTPEEVQHEETVRQEQDPHGEGLYHDEHGRPGLPAMEEPGK